MSKLETMHPDVLAEIDREKIVSEALTKLDKYVQCEYNSVGRLRVVFVPYFYAELTEIVFHLMWDFNSDKEREIYRWFDDGHCKDGKNVDLVLYSNELFDEAMRKIGRLS